MKQELIQIRNILLSILRNCIAEQVDTYGTYEFHVESGNNSQLIDEEISNKFNVQVAETIYKSYSQKFLMVKVNFLGEVEEIFERADIQSSFYVDLREQDEVEYLTISSSDEVIDKIFEIDIRSNFESISDDKKLQEIASELSTIYSFTLLKSKYQF